MNYSKIVDIITGIMAFAGFFLLMCIAGTCDYLDATHQGWSIAPMALKALIAFVLMLPFVIRSNRKEDDNDNRNHSI